MEIEIELIAQRLEQDSLWADAISKVDESLFYFSLESVRQIIAYFAHEENLDQNVAKILWSNLETEMLHICRELDNSGISSIVSRIAPEYLRNFSYTDATEFRSFEEGQVNELGLEVPSEGWELFWRFVDQHKDEVLSKMQEFESTSFYQLVLPTISSGFNNPPTNYRHLSPFRWSKALIVGLSGAIMIIDAFPHVVAISAGLSVGSMVGALAAQVVDAGLEDEPKLA